MKILAIDFGMKRMGFAIGNPVIDSAIPIEPLEYKKKDHVYNHIKNLISQYEVTHILIGYPLNMDGSKSKITEAVDRFKANLLKALDSEIKIEYVDERLSSFEAAEELKALRPDYKKKKEILDSMAAKMILQRYMEKK